MRDIRSDMNGSERSAGPVRMRDEADFQHMGDFTGKESSGIENLSSTSCNLPACVQIMARGWSGSGYGVIDIPSAVVMLSWRVIPYFLYAASIRAVKKDGGDGETKVVIHMDGPGGSDSVGPYEIQTGFTFRFLHVFVKIEAESVILLVPQMSSLLDALKTFVGYGVGAAAERETSGESEAYFLINMWVLKSLRDVKLYHVRINAD